MSPVPEPFEKLREGRLVAQAMERADREVGKLFRDLVGFGKCRFVLVAEAAGRVNYVGNTPRHIGTQMMRDLLELWKVDPDAPLDQDTSETEGLISLLNAFEAANSPAQRTIVRTAIMGYFRAVLNIEKRGQDVPPVAGSAA